MVGSKDGLSEIPIVGSSDSFTVGSKDGLSEIPIVGSSDS